MGILGGLLILLLLQAPLAEAGVRGGLVLMFDDGYPNWVDTIAPELARVGGVATGYVSVARIHSEKLTFEDLETLQDCYGWEIGTHTYHHFNPLEYVKRKSLSAWVSQELVPSVRELRSHGLEVRSLSFPYDATAPEIWKEAGRRLESFRVPEPLALGQGLRPDRSIPGTEISLGNYVPLELIKKWIDLAHERGSLLFLYGHQVLPDRDFQTGTVESVSQHTLIARENLHPNAEPDLYLVPDISRRFTGVPIRVAQVEGNKIQVGRGDLPRLTKPGATFMIGPGYGIRLSDFRSLIDYAARKLKFYTVHQVVSGQWQR